MSDGDDRLCGEDADGLAPRGRDAAPPCGAVALVEFDAAIISHGLGYFRAERFVIFGYCPGGGEVVWKDGGSSGFGAGGWRIFLEEIAPSAQRRGINLGSVNHIGTHVLLMDRLKDAVYAVPRESAETFLAEVNGVAPPKRPCLCAMPDCRSCPVRTCPHAGSVRPFDSNQDQPNPALTSGKPSTSVNLITEAHFPVPLAQRKAADL